MQPQDTDKPGLAARMAARDLMTGVTEDGALLSEIMGPRLAPLDPADRARAQRLATEALRWSGRCDRILGPLLRQRPPEPVFNTLRLALWEIYGDGQAAHGAVDAAVEMTARTEGLGRYKGLVNGVLRAAGRAGVVWGDLPSPELPKWLRRPLVQTYGKEAVAAIEAAHLRGAPTDLTWRNGPVAGIEGSALPGGSFRLTDARAVSALPGYDDGAFWVQDAAAALPARLIAPQPEESVLDLCAAPGGKTLQLAAAGAAVTAVDISERRLARLHENLARTGLTAEVAVADALTYAPDAPFDAVLLDAPCSATGTIRRHPDLPHAKRGLDLAPLVELQARLIDRAVALTRPGGRVVFCTCSLLPDEGERQIEAALVRHPGLAVVPPALPWLSPDWIGPDGGIRLRPDFWPDLGGMDGFFIATLQIPA